MTQPLRIAIIMAGGAGERFWPLSRRTRPKQLLRLTRVDQSMLEEAVERIAPIVAREHIYVVTARHLVEPIREAATGLPPENIIGEPCKRNTAGCLVYAAAVVQRRHGDEGRPITMAVLTADHRIGEADLFRTTVETALAAAEQHGALVTLGIEPTRAETGYGYIEVAEGANPCALEGAQPGAPEVYAVQHFREKPDAPTAESYAASGRHFWNSGMFFWTMEAFLRELEQATPAHAEAVRTIAEALAAGDDDAADRLFAALNDISIDYALLERARRVLVVRARFPWDDVGALDALARCLPADEAGNVAVGDPLLIDTRNCMVYNEPGAEAIAVAAVGVEGLTIVVTRDGVLVMPRDRAQDVRSVVSELRRRGAPQL